MSLCRASEMPNALRKKKDWMRLLSQLQKENGCSWSDRRLLRDQFPQEFEIVNLRIHNKPLLARWLWRFPLESNTLPYILIILLSVPHFIFNKLCHLFFSQDLMSCKSILSEYTDKMSLKRPIYTTKHHKGSVPFFQSTLVFDGVVYTSDVSRSKKEAEQLAARAAILSLHGI